MKKKHRREIWPWNICWGNDILCFETNIESLTKNMSNEKKTFVTNIESVTNIWNEKKGDPETFVAAKLRYCSHDHGPMWRRLLFCGFLSCFTFFCVLIILCQCQFNCGKHVIPTAWPRCLVVSSMKTVLSLSLLSHFIK